MLIVLAAAAAIYQAWLRQPAVHDFDVSDTALVVLPLHTGSQHDDAVLAQGFSAELIERLAIIKDLRVIGNASAQRAVSENFDSRQLQWRLGATHSLSGTLRIQATQAYVELRLIDVASGQVVLAQTYGRAIDEMSLLSQDIALGVAKSLKLLIPAVPDAARIEPDAYRSYCEALHLAEDRARALESLRALVAAQPNFARAHAALAREIVGEARPERLAPGELEEIASEAKRALDLDPYLAQAHVTLAILACRTGDWARCMPMFQHALELNPSDTFGRMAYVYWLGALGFVDQGLREAEIAWRLDPLSPSANFTRGRLLDTVGRHAEASRYLEAVTPPSAGLVYARWHNAVWRTDTDAAAKLAVSIPESDGFREAYLVVSEALIEPRLWSEALPLISTSERATGRMDVLRLLTPDPDYAVIVGGLEGMLRNGWPSYYLLLWMPEYAKMRHDPSFQDFLKRTRLIDYWRAAGWPPQCRAEGEGALCD
ncbi:MAG: hypothetical protein E6K53_03300 [Gammaproteobacteria bacterium]|nr:MAG: hypothetical protein E6K53_03300 [Gammaproteobacteria bacterium]